MTHWEDRPIEVANLFNPAFCCINIHKAVGSYTDIKKQGMPFQLSFLILPFVLHKSTRDNLPKTKATRFLTWFQNNPETSIGLADRVRKLVPYTKESIIFGMHTNSILINTDGNLLQKNKKLKPTWENESEPSECLKKSEFIGKWLAEAGEASTIFTICGIKP